MRPGLVPVGGVFLGGGGRRLLLDYGRGFLAQRGDDGRVQAVEGDLLVGGGPAPGVLAAEAVRDAGDGGPGVPQAVLPLLGCLSLLELLVPAVPLGVAPFLVGPERLGAAPGLLASEEGLQRQALLLTRSLDGLRPVEVPHQQCAASVGGRLDAGHPVVFDVGEEPGGHQRGQECGGHPAPGPAGGDAARGAVLVADQLPGRGPGDGRRVAGGPLESLRLLLLSVLLPVVDGRGGLGRDLYRLGGGVRGRGLLLGGLGRWGGRRGGRRGQAVGGGRAHRSGGVPLPQLPGGLRAAAPSDLTADPAHLQAVEALAGHAELARVAGHHGLDDPAPVVAGDHVQAYGALHLLGGHHGQAVERL
ncbi:hypothetical protein [Streptomyces sp. ISL-96]|uniref:hypothetical protein n=1 Tax=Streptomyces sp. ISL-96 TaxID=2819191 RepID=UPI001BE6478D|nr:hypothetical protein [Streptomyces sp. ISL-96]